MGHLRIHAKFLENQEYVYQESNCLINGKIAFDNISTKGCLYYCSSCWYISFDYNSCSYVFCQYEDCENTDLPPLLWFRAHDRESINSIIALEIFDTGKNIKG